MFKSVRYVMKLLSLISCCLCLMFLFSACSDKSEKESVESPAYAKNLAIEVTLQQTSSLEGLPQHQIIYTVSNNGDKTVLEILGEVVFYNRDGTQIG